MIFLLLSLSLGIQSPSEHAPGGKGIGHLAVLGGNKDGAQMEDGDGCFDLDDLEYSFDLGEYQGATTHVLSAVNASYWKWERD